MTYICKKCGYRAAHEIEKKECYCFTMSFASFRGPAFRFPKIEKYIRKKRCLNILYMVGTTHMNQLRHVSDFGLLKLKGIGWKSAKLIRRGINRYQNDQKRDKNAHLGKS